MLFSEMVEQFKDAFAGVTLGDGMSLRDAQVADSYGRKPYDRSKPYENVTDDWQKIPLAELERDNIPHLDFKGLRYYLPALAIALVENYEPNSLRVIGTLGAVDLRGERTALLPYYDSFFTAKQKKCIALFLINLPTYVELEPDQAKVCERAFDHYWKQFLEFDRSA